MEYVAHSILALALALVWAWGLTELLLWIYNGN